MPQDAQPTDPDATDEPSATNLALDPVDEAAGAAEAVDAPPSEAPEAGSPVEDPADVDDGALSAPSGEQAETTATVAVSDSPSDAGWSVPQTVGAGVVALVLIAVMGRAIVKRSPVPGLPEAPRLPEPSASKALPPPGRDDASDLEAVEEEAPAQAAEPGLGARLVAALSRTSAVLRDRVQGLFGRPIDEALLEELEEILLIADVGVSTSQRILDHVRSQAAEPDVDLAKVLRDEMSRILGSVHRPLVPREADLWVILVVGVNGSGKTTTIGKLASRLQAQGRRVLLAAGDTYRAAAAEQLGIWAERSGADLVRHKDGADPAAVAYDALEAAKSRGRDVVIIDTAGRLQTRKPLMEQLSKMRRVIQKQVPDAPHDTLLVVDGTMGQNALSQARLFHEATPLTGVAVTKLDGTAKGGMVLAIASEMGLPVQLIGVGEQVGDLQDFDPEPFVDAIV